MNILIYNKGSFANECKKEISKSFPITSIEINGKIDLNLSHIVNLAKNHDECNIIYISGEVRKVDKMDFLNFELPKKLLDLCLDYNVGLIYLSTLSVFGFNLEDVIKLNSKRSPIDSYGITKNKFDSLVEKTRVENPNVRISGIYPASFYSGNGRSSIEKYSNIILRYSYIFKYIILPGSLTYIERKEVINKIVILLKSGPEKDYILSNTIQLSEISKKNFGTNSIQLKVVRIPLLFFNILSIFISKKNIILLKMLFRGSKYE